RHCQRTVVFVTTVAHRCFRGSRRAGVDRGLFPVSWSLTDALSAREEVAAMPSGRAERVCLLPGLGGRPRSRSLHNNSRLPHGSADPFVVPWVRGKPAE